MLPRVANMHTLYLEYSINEDNCLHSQKDGRAEITYKHEVKVRAYCSQIKCYNLLQQETKYFYSLATPKFHQGKKDT